MADTTERLMLQVDASVELLRRHMTEAEQPLDRFEKRAEKMAANVDQKLAAMGKGFGPFAQLAESAAQRAEKSFESSFSQIQRMAATAIKAPTIDGRVDIGVDGLRAGADAARQQALSYGLITDAARKVALAERDSSDATRLFIQAGDAARIEAERQAAALYAEAGALERIQIELMKSADATELFVTSHQRLAAATAQEQHLAVATADAATEQRALAAAALLVRDAIDPMFAAQQRFDVEMTRAETLYAAGTITLREYTQAQALAREALQNHAQAVAGSVGQENQLVNAHRRGVVSAGQLRAANQQLSYQVSDVAVSFAGGISPMVIFAQQGSQVIQAISLMKGEAGGFIGFLGGPWGAAILGAVSILGVMATSHHTAAGAEVAHADAATILKAAIDRLNASAATENHTTRQGIQDDIDRANSTRVLAVEKLKLAKANLQANQAQLNRFANEGGDGARGAAGGQGALVANNLSQISTLDAQIADASKASRVGQIKLAMRDIAGATDAATAATQRYDDAIDRLSRRREKGLISQDVFDRAALRATTARNAAQLIVRAEGPGASVELTKRQQQVADLEKLKVGASGKDLKRINDQIALGKKQIGYLEQGVSASAAIAASGSAGSGRAKRGPSAETLAKREEAARQRLLDSDTAYNDEERQARHKLLEATRKTADSEEQRDSLLREDINAEADATKKKIANQLAAGDITKPQAEHLDAINESTRVQRLQNVKIAAATRTIEKQYDAQQEDLQSSLAVMRIREDLAITEADRRRIARQILDAEQELRRNALERVTKTSQDPDEVAKARRSLGNLPKIEAAENDQFNQSTAGPLEQYRDRLVRATSDTNEALQNIAVDGFGSLEDAGSRAAASAVTDLLHIGGVAGDVIGGIISDLARLALQKAIVAAIGGGFLGFSGGGTPSELPGYADGGTPGGLLQGPGTGTSDSILAILGGGKGAIRVSTEEFIVNAAATKRNLPLLHAINSNRMPRFAGGGALTPTLRVPRLPDLSSAASASSSRTRVEVDVKPSALFATTVRTTTAQMIGASAGPIMAGAQDSTIRRLQRPSLPGGTGWE